MDEFTQAFLVALLWSGSDDSGESLDVNYEQSDISEETLQKAVEDCRIFQEKNWEDISHNLSGAGHDFLLTRNGCGSGFWDGDWGDLGDKLTAAAKEFPVLEVYIGDDNKIYTT